MQDPVQQTPLILQFPVQNHSFRQRNQQEADQPAGSCTTQVLIQNTILHLLSTLIKSRINLIFYLPFFSPVDDNFQNLWGTQSTRVLFELLTYNYVQNVM